MLISDTWTLVIMTSRVHKINSMTRCCGRIMNPRGDKPIVRLDLSEVISDAKDRQKTDDEINCLSFYLKRKRIDFPNTEG